MLVSAEKIEIIFLPKMCNVLINISWITVTCLCTNVFI